MRHLFLKRTYKTNGVTIGMLVEENILHGLTLENPWIGNEPDISCIPDGNYVCELRRSPKYGEIYEVLGVDGREHILIHWGNYERDTQGCILIGTGLMWDTVEEKEAISQSKTRFDEFMNTMGGNPFMLTVETINNNIGGI